MIQRAFLLAVLFCTQVTAQAQKPSVLDLEVQTHYLAKDYDMVVVFSNRADELNDTSLYRVARAYYRKNDAPNARKFFDRTLEKNKDYANAWFFRAILNMYDESYSAALADANKAVELNPKDAENISLKGDILMEMEEYEQARDCYQKSLKLEDPPLNAWVKIGETYSGQDKHEKAAAAFREALPKIAEDTALYLRCLYNVGVSDYLDGQFEKAEATFLELTEKSSNDYQAIAKLIQAYYAQKKYKPANKLKPLLYEAWKAEALPKYMKDDFCFDQFDWKDKRVVVYERFDESDDLYYKHVFYVYDKAGKKEFQVQTEYSAAVAMAHKKYVLGMQKGDTHYTYFQFLFDADIDYKELKARVLDIMNGDAKPSSSSRSSRN